MVLKALSALWHVAAHVVMDLLRPKLVIVEDRPTALVLNASGYTVRADARRRTVALNSSVVSSFNSIQAIRIQHVSSGSGNRQSNWWIVGLLLSAGVVVRLGRTRDAEEASMAAARLSTITERPVVAVTQNGRRSVGVEP